MNYLKVTVAARIKGVSRAAVTQAIASGKIHSKEFGGTHLVLQNRAFENWKPKRSKES